MTTIACPVRGTSCLGAPTPPTPPAAILRLALALGSRWAALFTVVALLWGYTADGASEVAWEKSDAQSTPLTVTDAAGVVMAELDTTAYGHEAVASPIDDTWHYLGKARYSNVGLIGTGARLYAPRDAMFYSPDPVFYGQDAQVALLRPYRIHPYRYAYGSPLNWSDPTGREEDTGWVSSSGWTAGGGNTKPEPPAPQAGWGEWVQALPSELGNLATKAGDALGDLRNSIVRTAEHGWSQAAPIISGVLGGSNDGDRTLGEQIANGHAGELHMAEVGARDLYDLAELIDGIVMNPDATGDGSRGRVAYWNEEHGVIVIEDPNNPDGGTVFRPLDGRAYFEDHFNER